VRTYTIALGKNKNPSQSYGSHAMRSHGDTGARAPS